MKIERLKIRWEPFAIFQRLRLRAKILLVGSRDIVRRTTNIMQNQFALKKNGFRLTSVIAVAALLVGVLGFAARPVAAQDTPNAPDRSITVSGSGEVFGTPDIAYITLGVDQADADASAAIDSANTTLAAIVSALTDAGVAEEDVQTASYNIYPEDRVDPASGQPTGNRVYHVNLTVNVTIRDINNVGAVITAGLGAGANTIHSLNFGIADTKSLEAEARKAAVADALDRAQQLADVTGVTLGEPVMISETFNYPVPMPNRAGGGFAMDMAAPQINAGQLSVGITVNITYGISG